MYKVLMLLSLSLLLAGCGQKGGLYLPDTTENEDAVDPNNDMSVDTNVDPTIDNREV